MPSDHFSDKPGAYAQYRPRYPDQLFEWLAGQCVTAGRVWDCATGSGQAATALAAHFEEVVATDLSAQQLAEATPHPRVRYAVTTAEESGLPSASVDLVTVAQALHWFDFDAFYKEIRRVARSGALIAVWAYGLHRVSPEIDPLLRGFYTETVGSYWPPERRHIELAYESIPFPFPRLETPDFTMEAQWGFSHLIGYLRTWSAVKRFEKDRGYDPVTGIEGELRRAWGDAGALKRIRWPLTLKLGRITW